MANPGRPPKREKPPPLPAVIRNYVPQSGVNPGFEPEPWQPRRELTADINGNENSTGHGKYCPRHLHFLTDDEKKPEHYPFAKLGADGLPDRFCWCCGRPLTVEGLSAKRHKGYGKPCPACGFRRKQRTHPNQIAAANRNNKLQQARRKEITDTGASTRPRIPKVSELLAERARAEAEKVMRPYMEALDLRPKESWSPGSKLGFYHEQVQVAERLLDRAEGRPMSRHRHVTADDADVLASEDLSPSTLAQLAAAIATGADVDALLGEVEVEDADWSEVSDSP